MSEEYVLVVGLYPAAEQALLDLRDLTNPGPTAEVIAGGAVVHRTSRGAALQGSGGSLAFGIGTGIAGGIVAGIFLPVPLAAAVIGGVVGGLVGWRLRAAESRQAARMLDSHLAVGESALVVVALSRYRDEVAQGMTRARTTTRRALDDPEVRRLARGLVRGNPTAVPLDDPR